MADEITDEVARLDALMNPEEWAGANPILRNKRLEEAAIFVAKVQAVLAAHPVANPFHVGQRLTIDVQVTETETGE